MIKNSSFKTLLTGFSGGLIAIVLFFEFANPIQEPINRIQSDQLIDGNQNTPTFSANFSGLNTTDFKEASKNSINSVVHVTTKVVQTTFQRDIFQEFFYGPGAGGREFKQFGEGAGSGVIVSSEGYIVTNNHVIESASEIEVTLNDNSKYTATVIGADPSTDIAVLKIEASGLPAISLGNSDDLAIGEWVLAVGNPFNLTSTVTAGIVSAKARNINLLNNPNKNVVPIESFIQTDAAVNPGNSGGPLLDANGDVIGINTFIKADSENLGFAIPINFAKKIANELRLKGAIDRRISFGVNAVTYLYGKNRDQIGLFIDSVNYNDSARNEELYKGDIIVAVEGYKVESFEQIKSVLVKLDLRAGDDIKITVLRENDLEVISLTLGSV